MKIMIVNDDSNSCDPDACIVKSSDITELKDMITSLVPAPC